MGGGSWQQILRIWFSARWYRPIAFGDGPGCDGLGNVGRRGWVITRVRPTGCARMLRHAVGDAEIREAGVHGGHGDDGGAAGADLAKARGGCAIADRVGDGQAEFDAKVPTLCSLKCRSQCTRMGPHGIVKSIGHILVVFERTTR